MGQTDTKDEGGTEPGAKGAHQEVLLPSTQASHCCQKDPDQDQEDWSSPLRQGCRGRIQREPCQTVQPHQPFKIEGVEDTKDVEFYLGKKIMYMYRAKTLKNESKFRTMWGKVCRAHGTSGIVRAKFKKNLPPSALGAPVRIMLFPSRV